MKIFEFIRLVLIAAFAMGTILTADEASSLERPFIWIQAKERQALVEKINSEEWAGSLFARLKERADAAVGLYETDRDAYLKGLPLEWFEGRKKAPRLARMTQRS